MRNGISMDAKRQTQKMSKVRDTGDGKRKPLMKGFTFLHKPFRRSPSKECDDDFDMKRRSLPRCNTVLFEPVSPPLAGEHYDSHSDEDSLKNLNGPLELVESAMAITEVESDGEDSMADSENSQTTNRSCILLPNGDEYEGGVRNGLMNGLGVLSHVDGRVYKGEFIDDMKHGMGITCFPGGNKHIGEYADGFMSGRGTFLFANGQKYVGSFRLDQFHGEGVLTLHGGNHFHGKFFNGSKLAGSYIFHNGEIRQFNASELTA